MKLNKVLSLVLVFAMALLVFASCGSKSGIVGSWKAESDGVEMTFTFNSNGKGSISTMGVSIDMTYTTDGDKITIKSEMFGDEDMEGTYEINGNKLALTFEGDTQEFERA